MSENGTMSGTPSQARSEQPTTGATETTGPLWFGERAPASSTAGRDPAPSAWTSPPPAAPLQANPPTSPQRPRRQWPGMVALAALTAALASGGTYAAVRAGDDVTATPPVTSSSASGSPGSGTTTIGQVAPHAPNWTAIAAAVTPSVVAIKLEVQGGAAQGSGVVFDTSGHIVTNNHVVDGAVGSIQVTLADGRILPAKVAGTDPATDLAVITLDKPPSDLRPIALGDSDALKVGDPVMAVGNPLGLASTVTTGIVSALNRPVQAQENPGPFGQQGGTQVVTNAIQTSAAINPGNSGGALIDANGRLIGINSSIASTGGSGGNIGIGFAIPVNETKAIADQLIASGKAAHAYLGVSLVDGTAKDGNATRTGAEVRSVEANTPAAQAGLRDGDVVIAVDGEPVESSASLVGHIREQTVGGKVRLTIVRDGARQDIEVTLAARPDTLS